MSLPRACPLRLMSSAAFRLFSDLAAKAVHAVYLCSGAVGIYGHIFSARASS